MTLISFDMNYISYFVLFSLCHLFLLKQIMSFIFIQIYYMHYVFQCILCQLFLWQSIISMIFNYFIPIEIIDIIALPLHVVRHVALCLQRSSLSLHIARPSQCPRVDKPHPAFVSETRLAGRSWKVIAQAVGNGSGVADWNYWQFSQNTFNENDVENWFLVVWLV